MSYPHTINESWSIFFIIKIMKHRAFHCFSNNLNMLTNGIHDSGKTRTIRDFSLQFHTNFIHKFKQFPFLRLINSPCRLRTSSSGEESIYSIKLMNHNHVANTLESYHFANNLFLLPQSLSWVSQHRSLYIFFESVASFRENDSMYVLMNFCCSHNCLKAYRFTLLWRLKTRRFVIKFSTNMRWMNVRCIAWKFFRLLEENRDEVIAMTFFRPKISKMSFFYSLTHIVCYALKHSWI